MLSITICVGSSCSVHGSEELASELENLIAKADLADRVELVGAFCMEQCSTGVSIRVGNKTYSGLQPADAESFFRAEIMPVVQSEEAP